MRSGRSDWPSLIPEDEAPSEPGAAVIVPGLE